MENERELLELAAKACGLDLEWCEFWQCMAKNLGVIDGFDRDTCWNPLKDDGDAFRLAGKLRIDFTWQPAMEEVIAYPTMHDTLEITEEYKEYSDHGLPVDTYRYAALRRAIVRAAAEIGRAMQSDKR